MREFYWTIDESLGLSEVAAIALADHTTLIAPEQTIDTLLLRNLDVIPQVLFGSPAKFLFHSAIYWGEFDVGCALADGRFVAFENKGRRLTKADFRKFLRDTQKLAVTAGYAEMRYRHVIADWSGYSAISQRMFAASFLGIRCDIEKNRRDLIEEACQTLGVEEGEFQQRFAARNQWHDVLNAEPTWHSYLGNLADVVDSRLLLPILLAPNSDMTQIERWCREIGSTLGIRARLATYRLGTRSSPQPHSLTIRDWGEFEI